jgi:CDP-diglyceride synthetase
MRNRGLLRVIVVSIIMVHNIHILYNVILCVVHVAISEWLSAAQNEKTKKPILLSTIITILLLYYIVCVCVFYNIIYWPRLIQFNNFPIARRVLLQRVDDDDR